MKGDTTVTKSSSEIQSIQQQPSSQQKLSHSREILGRAVLTTPHRRMPVIRIAPDHQSTSSSVKSDPMMVASPAYVTKFSLCESLGCALRDLRVIDQFNGRYSGPAFLARSNCVIVNVGHVRAIVMRDQVLIFLPETTSNINVASNAFHGISSEVSVSANSNRNVGHIQETIENLVDALVTYLNSIYHSSHNLVYANEGCKIDQKSKDEIYAGQNWRLSSHSLFSRSNKKKISRKLSDEKKSYESLGRAPPFELVVIEALLGHVCSYEASKVAKLISSSQSILDGIAYNFSEKDVVQKKSRKKDAFLEMQVKLGELLPLKNKIDSLEAKCTEVSGAIEEVLKNDEDMAAMQLSAIAAGTGVLEGDPDSLHVDVELLFEDYLLQMDELILALRSMQSTVRNTEEVVEIELDLLRNRIMRYEMLIELSGFVVGVAAAVTSGFGMNLLSGFEEHPTMFWDVTKSLLVVMIFLGWGILRKLANDNIL